MAESLEERVRRLEDVAFEGDGLTRAVERLGLNASALGDALLTVDKQQQMLTKLGREVAEVTIKTDDVARTQDRRRTADLHFRKRALTRIYMTAMLLVLALVGLVAGLQVRATNQHNSRKVLCDQQAYTAHVVQQFTSSQISIEQSNTHIDDVLRAKRLASLGTLNKAFPDPPCLKEFHK